jgi:DNA replication protein DnaC
MLPDQVLEASDMKRKHMNHIQDIIRRLQQGEIFANDLLASAALDRLTHHAHTLVIRGDSFRQRGRRKENASNKLTPEAPIIPES